MTTPQPGRAHDDTYCRFTIYQINIFVTLVVVMMFEQCFSLFCHLYLGGESLPLSQSCKLIENNYLTIQ